MKPCLLLLTNLYNGDEKEDFFLSRYLSQSFDVILSHPTNALKIEEMVNTVLIRNIWPTKDYHAQYIKTISHFTRKKISTYNPLHGKGDTKGKDYLVELYKARYPVIPSIDRMKDLSKLPFSSYYILKPKLGGSSFGVRKLTRKQLPAHLKQQILQPYIPFEYELSFYFIDNKLQHTLYAPNKKERWKLKEFHPSHKDRAFANRFVEWNALPYGIQRVDACRTKNGELLLMEIEDLCPYLSLLEISPKLRNRFLKNLVQSIQKNCLEH